VRILRNTIPAWSSEALFFNVVVSHKKSRYPRAAHTGATIHHYGWIRSEAQMNLKSESVLKFWNNRTLTAVNYSRVDSAVLRGFSGSHPDPIRDWLPKGEGLFKADRDYQPTARERKHRWMLWLEKTFGLKFSRKHYRLVR